MPVVTADDLIVNDMVDLNDLVLKRTRDVYVALGDGYGITVSWNPDAMTPQVWAGFLEARSNSVDPFAIADGWILPLATGWNLTKGGEPYPLNAENLVALGLIIVRRIANAIDDDFGKAANPEGLKVLKGGSNGTSSVTPEDGVLTGT